MNFFKTCLRRSQDQRANDINEYSLHCNLKEIGWKKCKSGDTRIRWRLHTGGDALTEYTLEVKTLFGELDRTPNA